MEEVEEKTWTICESFYLFWRKPGRDSVPFFSGCEQKLVLQAWDVGGLRWSEQPDDGLAWTWHWTLLIWTPPPHVTEHCTRRQGGNDGDVLSITKTWYRSAIKSHFILTHLRPGRRVPSWWKWSVREGCRQMGAMGCPPLMDEGSCAGGTLGQGAGPLQLHCGLGNMVALLVSKLSVFSCSVL